MKTWLTLIALGGLLLTLPGCSACGVSGWSNCRQSWDFYEECDLIEGRRARCNQGCNPECCDGMVVESMIGTPVRPCVPSTGGAVVVEEEVAPGSPMPGDIVEEQAIEVAPGS